MTSHGSPSVSLVSLGQLAVKHSETKFNQRTSYPLAKKGKKKKHFCYTIQLLFLHTNVRTHPHATPTTYPDGLLVDLSASLTVTCCVVGGVSHTGGGRGGSLVQQWSWYTPCSKSHPISSTPSEVPPIMHMVRAASLSAGSTSSIDHTHKHHAQTTPTNIIPNNTGGKGWNYSPLPTFLLHNDTMQSILQSTRQLVHSYLDSHPVFLIH